MTFRRKFLMATTAGLLTAGALSGAYAAAGGKGDSESAETAAAMAAKTTLFEAVTRAEADSKGRAFKAGLEEEDGAVRYEIGLIAGDSVMEVTVDPSSGKIVDKDSEGLLARLLGEEHEEVAALDSARVTLRDAITGAEKATGGRALEAELEVDAKAAAPMFEVEVAKADGGRVKVTVDAASGKILGTGPAGEHEDDDDGQNG